MSTLPGSAALAGGDSFERGATSMQQSHNFAADFSLTPHRMVDLLSVMSWADMFWTDEVENMALYPSPLGRENMPNWNRRWCRSARLPVSGLS